MATIEIHNYFEKDKSGELDLSDLETARQLARLVARSTLHLVCTNAPLSLVFSTYYNFSFSTLEATIACN